MLVDRICRGLPQLSLRYRLLLATLLTTGLALVALGLLLSALFRDHARQQFVERLTADLDQVIARLEVDAQGRPTLDAARLSDPRWTRPHSGLYWQVDGAGANGTPGLLRSRSLWDDALTAPRDAPRPGELHVHDVLNHGREPLIEPANLGPHKDRKRARTRRQNRVGLLSKGTG